MSTHIAVVSLSNVIEHVTDPLDGLRFGDLGEVEHLNPPITPLGVFDEVDGAEEDAGLVPVVEDQSEWDRAADAELTRLGWRRTGPWSGDGHAYAPLERAA